MDEDLKELADEIEEIQNTSFSDDTKTILIFNCYFSFISKYLKTNK